MFSKFSFGTFLLAFVMTKLISAILITLKPFGVNFEAWPQVYITLNLRFSVEDLCVANIVSMYNSRPLIPLYFLIFRFSYFPNL